MLGLTFQHFTKIVGSWNIIPKNSQVSCFIFGFKPKIRVTTLIQSYLKSYASTWWKKAKQKNVINNGYS
jgi:hypothetical protein